MTTKRRRRFTADFKKRVALELSKPPGPRYRTPVHRAGDQSDQSVRNHDPPHRQRDDHDTEQVNGVLRDENRHGDVLDSVFDVLSPAIVCRGPVRPERGRQPRPGGNSKRRIDEARQRARAACESIGPAAAVEGGSDNGAC